jgi:hypothetical protein
MVGAHIGMLFDDPPSCRQVSHMKQRSSQHFVCEVNAKMIP